MNQPGASTETEALPQISSWIFGLSVGDLFIAVLLNRSDASHLPREATHLIHGFLHSLASAVGGLLHLSPAAARIVPAIAAHGADRPRNFRVPVPIGNGGTLSRCCPAMVIRSC